MTPFSQELESPEFPGRFNGTTTTSVMCQSYSETAWDTTVQNEVIDALNNHRAVMYGSYQDTKDANGKTDLVSDHMLYITGYDSVKNVFVMNNPWGTNYGAPSWNPQFDVSVDQLWNGGGEGGFVIANAGTGNVSATAGSTVGDQVNNLIATMAAVASQSSVGATSVLTQQPLLADLH